MESIAIPMSTEPMDQNLSAPPGPQGTSSQQPDQPAQAAQTPPEPEVESLTKALEEEKTRSQSFLSNWQRAQADYINFKRRAEQDKDELMRFANGMLLLQLLPILDDLERAFVVADAKLAGLTWVDGVRLVYRKLQGILEAQGVKEIPTVGKSSDPKYHQALLFADGEEEGKIVEDLQKGYMFHDRVLRPAVVKVGRGKLAGEGSGSQGEAGPAGTETQGP